MRSIIIQPTSRCYLACPGCYNIRTEDNLSLEDLTLFLRKEYELDGVRKVSLSGGDPLLYPRIQKLVEILSQLGFLINLDTVGLPFVNGFTEKETADLLSRIGTLGVPLDGIDDTTISLFRPGLHFQTILDILTLVERHNTKVCINTVLHHKNISVFAQLSQLINNLRQVKQWQVFQYMPIGQQEHSVIQQLSLADDELAQVSSFLELFPFRPDLKVELKDRQFRSRKYVIICSNGCLRIPEQDGFIGHIKEPLLLSERLIL